VRSLPEDVTSGGDGRLLEDRYLLGTRLRLRRVTRSGAAGAAEAPEHKLGQKTRPDPADPGLVLHTTMYLSADEHSRLAVLPGADLRKVRHAVAHAGRGFAVDVFGGRHAGLVLVEIELADGGRVEPPPFAGPEVTGDERFTGGWLAFASDEALVEVLGLTGAG
jgi:hypothetical protein